MKLIKSTIITLLIYSSAVNLTAQSKGSVNIGPQYFNVAYLIENPIHSYEKVFETLLLSVGGEYRFTKFLSSEVYLGVFNIGSSDKIWSAQIAPIRLHFGKVGIGGFYIGPKIFFQSVQEEYSSFETKEIKIGPSLGYNFVSKRRPIVIGLNASVSRKISSAMLSIGYQI